MQEKTQNVKGIRVGRIFKTLVLMEGSTKITKTGFRGSRVQGFEWRERLIISQIRAWENHASTE